MIEQKKRGGARENAGRKAKDPTKKAVTVSFCLSPEEKEKLQQAIKESGLTQTAYIKSKLFN